MAWTRIEKRRWWKLLWRLHRIAGGDLTFTEWCVRRYWGEGRG